ncbi:histidine kinase [Hyphomicrobium sp.]|uniref:histidine kinase n=1 Tax=Hyphomicrobium sp. TaxID=82 RepID=UPI002FE30326
MLAYGDMRSGLARVASIIQPSRFQRIFVELRRLAQHAIYVRLLTLLFCIAVTSILIQAGSLFLFDYIPAARSVATKIHHQEHYWKSRLDLARAESSTDAEAIIRRLGDAYLNLPDSETSWLISRAHHNLSAEFENVGTIENKLKRATQDGWPTASWLQLADELVASYAQLGIALQHDAAIKQTTIVALQFVALLYLMFCIARIALEMRHVLVERLDRLVEFIPEKYSDGSAQAEGDEFLRLEHKISSVTARLERYTAEATWTSKISEHLRRVVSAQEFLFRFVEMINEHPLNEAMLRRMLYSLERALDVNNAAIIYTEDEPQTSTGRSMYSNHEPLPLSDGIFSELRVSGSSMFIVSNPDNTQARCVAVAFDEPSGEKGALLVEMDTERFLDDAEMQVLQITVGLLSLTSKFQNHDQEGRRIAVLEERAAIARELHDSLAQSLSFMKIQLARLQSSSVAVNNGPVIGELRAGLNNAYRELRELLATFRVHMDVRGLRYAIQQAIDEFSQRSSLSISLDNRLVNCELTANEEFHVLQVIREALSNIVHHASADSAFIELAMEANGSVVVTIDDDGVGCRPATDGHGHHGHTIMKERAFSLGGNIEIVTRPQGGTRVKLTFIPKSAQ